MPFLDPENLLRIFLVFVRLSGFFVASPFFSHGAVPVRVRVLLSILLAYSLVGLVPGHPPSFTITTVGLLFAVMIEALTGVVLGFAAQFIFWVIQFAGEILGFQMGLSLAQVLDPVNGEPSNPLGRLLSMTFLMVFILMEGHHTILRALVTSFELVPLAGARLTETGPLLLNWTGAFLLTALQLASPFVVTILLIDTALGVFARVVPQADLFSIGLPLKLLIGLGMSFFFLENFFPVVPGLISRMTDDLHHLIQVLIPG